MAAHKTEWQRGDKAKLALMVGVSRQYVTDYTKKRRAASLDRARILVEAAHKLGYSTTFDDWQNPKESQNPLFS